MELGVPSEYLKDRHGPCPLCNDGRDRFRWDNKEGKGTYICSQCGAGTGMDLAMKFTGLEFRDLAPQIDTLLGNKTLKTDRAKPELTEEQRRSQLRAAWKLSGKIERGSLADIYFDSRGIAKNAYPDALRFAPKLEDGLGGVRPCILAVISDIEGNPVSLHRTFLRGDGKAKAEMKKPRLLMPGSLPDGACVRLSEWVSGPLGVAEGLESAMAASALYDIPVWSTISSSILKNWLPPEGAEDIIIFGDNDPKYGGQSAAYALAHKLAVKTNEDRTPKHDVRVMLPEIAATDFNDVWLEHLRKSARHEDAA